MKQSDLQRVSEFERVLPRQDDTHAAVRFLANPKNLSKMHPMVFQQAAQLSTMPGIRDAIVVFPHAVPSHGVPDGCVFASGTEGIMLPAGIGWDINLGIRTLATNLIFPDVEKRMPTILQDIQRALPVGAKATGKIALSKRDLLEIFSQGARWIQENKSPDFTDELEYIEDHGDIPVSNLSSIPESLLEHQENRQFGTIKHFLEIQIVSEIFDVEKARIYGLFKNQILITYRAGSNSLGRAVWRHYYRLFAERMSHYQLTAPHPSLVHLPLDSAESHAFYQAVQCVSNYAIANRQYIAAQVYHILNTTLKDVEANTMYESATNTVRVETHSLSSLPEKVYVYRKGCVRSQIQNEEDFSRSYHVVGNPTLLWSGMGHASYIISGKELLLEKSFGSIEQIHPSTPPVAVNDSTHIKQVKEQLITLRNHNETIPWRLHPRNYDSPRTIVDFWTGSNLASRIALVKPVGILLS